MSRSFYIKTMGCQMNEYDSDCLARSLITKGCIPVNDPAIADIILINTCAVRAKPEQKAVSFLGRMAAFKNKRPDLILGIVGCIAQQEGSRLIKRFPMLDLVMGPRQLEKFPEFLEKIIYDGKKIVATDLNSLPASPIHCKGYFRDKVSAFISVTEGCNNFCSYCIVPYVRGREVSRPPADIIAEASNLIADGVKEITLLGQNVISYHWNDCNFVSLLNEIAGLDGLLRIRFTTSHPKHLSKDVIQCFASIDKLCSHIHLPFQAGSDAILKSMRRGYSRDQYIILSEKLREADHDIAITSDVMVGFPGESEADFEQTLDLIRKVRFDNLFSFKYSDRKGTLAAKMQNKVSESLKIHRLEVLQKIQRQITLEKNQDLIGRHVQVLVEGQSKKGGQLTGRTSTNKIVNFISNNKKIGELVNVLIDSCTSNSLSG
ncbi:(Dimethylallyl)adenosine tRNA methylthiotransferase MiaB [uncultured Desulfobacterium sp.]|uniref:tRNA-2-methylthio-N(6)-dimethylallyladenosine synthase n=1 Tax=uncultured Desulfobacterium sp. TaxID=201089 RepID=A0A445N1I0_9BACT|nr:(Dimethylallyl)adenosine tRNA methylthiotransferase MiaB [uncultured Desulfobacterium sp.]